MGKRAYNITCSEMSSIFWGISFLMIVVVIVHLMMFNDQVGANNPGLGLAFMFLITLLCVSVFFSLISMAAPNYYISKNNLNVLIDRIANPDYIGWGRITRNKRLRFYTVRTGALGQTRGRANGEKADVINDGEYTLTLPNGNQLLITNDFLSSNVNLNDVRGWQLIKKHFGIFGFDVWNKALNDNQLMFKNEGDTVEEENKEK